MVAMHLVNTPRGRLEKRIIIIIIFIMGPGWHGSNDPERPSPNIDHLSNQQKGGSLHYIMTDNQLRWLQLQCLDTSQQVEGVE